jgi:hypothetical protein
MEKSRFTEAQIALALRQADRPVLNACLPLKIVQRL